jgi:hypothetical protein
MHRVRLIIGSVLSVDNLVWESVLSFGFTVRDSTNKFVSFYIDDFPVGIWPSTTWLVSIGEG